MNTLTYLTLAAALATAAAPAAASSGPAPPLGPDCNANGVPDATDIANGTSQDCNGNGVPDECDIASGTSLDLDLDGVPDECRSDCDGDLIPDFLEIAFGTQLDCNVNGVPDDCEVSGGAAADCNGNGVPDECDIAVGSEFDCNASGVPDACELADGSETDCNGNGLLDSCDIALGLAFDCNGDGLIDTCDPAADDCNGNGIIDYCDIADGTSLDFDLNEIPDECQPDCNGNGIPDNFDLAFGASLDCDGNGVPDECDIADGSEGDCNANGVPDSCEVGSGAKEDCNGNGLPDSCDLASGALTDCDDNGSPDACEIAVDPNLDLNGNGVLDSCECTITNYCVTSPNSVGSGATISSGGSPFLPANDFLLMASGMPAGNFGLFFYAQQQGQAPLGDGTLCLTGQLFRLPAQQTSGTGSATRLLDFANPPIPAGQITPGSTWSFQFWYRDPAGGPAGSNTTDGLEVTFCTSPGQEVTVLETFLTQDAEDARASGAAWGGGRLTPGQGGGSGRLGELVVPVGTVVTLDTNLQTFPLDGVTNPVMSNDVPGVDYDALDPQAWPTVTVDGNPNGEGFEFSRIDIDGTLVVTGSRPLRLFARGEAVIDGVIDLSGETPEPHLSNSGGDQAANPSDGQLTAAGGLGGTGGPAAGFGGQGGDRIDMSSANLPVMINIGGIFNPGAVNTGRMGTGVGGAMDSTGGFGGVQWPPMLPQNATPGTPAFGDAELSWIQVDNDSCRIAMVAGPGSGGAHALGGADGVAMSPFPAAFPGLLPTTPPPTPGADNGALGLEAPGSPPSSANQRNLDFWQNHLRGGSGGGGGGTHVYGSKMNGATGPGCGNGSLLFPLWDHSGAGGGGGGGAMQLAAGRRLALNERIDCSGGDGGSATVPGAPIDLCTHSGSIPSSTPDCEKYAAPGGGGAGGGVRLQAPTIQFAMQPGRLDVTGGDGGLGVGGSIGGAGSAGLVRLEFTEGFVDEATAAVQFAPLIAPSLPMEPGFNTPFPSAAILSIGQWGTQTLRPEAFSGSQSCWLQPLATSAVLDVEFVDDVAGAPDDLSRLGWNVDVIYDVPGVGERLFPYRGLPPVDPNDPYDEANYPFTELGGVDFETFLGTAINSDEPNLMLGSLFAVRFQGVRTSSSDVGGDLCALDLAGPDVVAGSLTPWVLHPAQLELFDPQPNLVRFAVVFDEPLKQFDPIVLQNLKGVTNLRLRTRLP